MTTLGCPQKLDSFLSKSSGLSSSLEEQHFEVKECIVETVFKLFVVTFATVFRGYPMYHSVKHP